jgi:hypothetical protein
MEASMRLVIALALSGLVGWVAWPGHAPPPGRPRTVARPAPGDDAALARAAAAGRLAEDPDRHSLRQAVLRAAERLAATPCDERARDDLRRASAALVTHLLDSEDKPLEFVMVDGRGVDASGYFNAAAGGVIRQAMRDGVLSHGDLPMPRHEARWLGPAKPSTELGRFACATG